MDKRWQVLTRVREVRTRQALNEVTRERRTQARAQANLEQARERVKGGGKRDSGRHAVEAALASLAVKRELTQRPRQAGFSA